MSKKERKQLTLHLSTELVDRVDQCIVEMEQKQHVRYSRTFFIAMAVMEYVKRLEEYEQPEVTTTAQ